MKIEDRFEPVGATMLIEPIKIEETSGGVIIVEMGKTTPVRGKIISVGKWSWRRPWILGSRHKKGDIVFFRRYAVDELEFTDENGNKDVLFIVDDEDIKGKLKQ